MTDTTQPGGDRSSEQELVAVGRIGRAHGIRGHVLVEPWTDDIDERFAVGVQLRTEPAERGPLVVAETRDHSGKLVVRFDGVVDRNGAEAIRSTLLVVAAADRPPIDDPDEFYDTDLIGLRVETVSGEHVGSVVDVLHSPGDSVLAIDRTGVNPEAAEALIPFRRLMVPVVDVAAGRLVIDPPDGLLDL